MTESTPCLCSSEPRHTPIFEGPLDYFPSGERRVYRFSNSHGASVIRHSYSYGGAEGKFEVAVLRFFGAGPEDYKLDYTTPITGDVIGHLTEPEVQDLLDKIAALPEAA